MRSFTLNSSQLVQSLSLHPAVLLSSLAGELLMKNGRLLLHTCITISCHQYERKLCNDSKRSLSSPSDADKVNYVKFYVSSNPEEDKSGHLQSPSWLSIFLWPDVSLVVCEHRKRVWSYMTLNVPVETRCHETNNNCNRCENYWPIIHVSTRFCSKHFWHSLPVLTICSLDLPTTISAQQCAVNWTARVLLSLLSIIALLIMVLLF